MTDEEPKDGPNSCWEYMIVPLEKSEALEGSGWTPASDIEFFPQDANAIAEAIGPVRVHWTPAVRAAISGDPNAKKIAQSALTRTMQAFVARWDETAQAKGISGTEHIRDLRRDSFKDALRPYPILFGAIARGVIAVKGSGVEYDTANFNGLLAYGVEVEGIRAERIAEELEAAGMRASRDLAIKIRETILKELDSFPTPQEARALQEIFAKETEEFRRRDPSYVPHVRRVELAVRITATRFIARRGAELVAQEAARAALATREVRIPSDTAIIPLFNTGAPERALRDAFSLMKNEEDGELKSVTISFRQLQNDGDQLSLEYNDPDFFILPAIKQNLATGRWREEALSVLPKILGPAALAVYFWTWADADDAGNIFFEPGEVARALGLSREQSRTRKQMVEIADTLTRVEMRLVRKFGPSMGEDGEYTGRLIQPSTEHFKITPSRDGSRGPRKILIYRHALPMVSIRRKYNVGIPRDAFQLVGLWEKGAGQKKAGYQALALLMHCYTLARTFATRDKGVKGDTTFLGPEGFEMPLEDVVTAAGFVKPGEFTEHFRFNIARARDAVKRLTGEFPYFGKGSEVFTGPDGKPRFRFVAPDELRRRNEGIAQAQPAKIEAAQARALARQKARRKA